MNDNWRNKPVVSVPKMAQIFGISRSLAYDLVKTGEVQAIRLGNRILIPTVKIKNILMEESKNA